MKPSAHTGKNIQNAASSEEEHGSALVLAIFVLALLTGMGVALLYVTENDMKMAKVDLRSKKAFYVAEAGIEEARQTLRETNSAGTDKATFSDELVTAAGANASINFDPSLAKPVFDSSGNVTSYTGCGDDTPVKSMTTFGEGKYAVYLTNDVVEGRTNKTDTDARAVITSIASAGSYSSAIVQAVIEQAGFPNIPATITLLGPNADFQGGNSNAKEYKGDDCPGGVPGLCVPVVGTIGSSSEASAEGGVDKPGTFTSCSETGTDTVDNIESTIDSDWNDCDYLHDLAESVRSVADVVGDSSTPTSSLGTQASPKIVYIEGDYSAATGGGLLFVTGELSFGGNDDWYGTMFAIGKGAFHRNGGGNGNTYGGIVVANIAGPDGIMWTSDDCSGPDGVVGNADDGVAQSTYHNNGDGNHKTQYCTTAIQSVEALFPYKVVSFRKK